MSILSFEFLLLAAGVTIVYYLLPLRLRWMALLSGSAAFLLLSGWQSAAHLSAAALVMWGGALLLKSEAVHKVNISLQSFEGNGGDEPEDYLRACADFAAAAGESGKLCVLRLWNSGGFETLNPRIRAELARRFPQPWEEFRRSLRLEPRVFLESGDMFDWPDMSAAELGESCFCYGLRDQVGVLCDGTVVPCCLDHDGDVPLGNLFERELDEILASPRAVSIREGFSRRRAVEELCRRCGYARRF